MTGIMQSDEMEDVPLFKPSFRVQECLDEMRECLETGWSGAGYKTVDFETAWKAYTGHDCAHFLNSATAGLFLALAILKKHHGWSANDEIISTPITFVSTNHAVRAAGLRLVFADVDRTGCLDPESLLLRLTPRTRAVIFVGLGGNVGQYDAIVRICRQRGLKIILDAAHMSGTRLNDRVPGLSSDVAVYSYQAVKNLPTADSGMICFRNAQLDAEARRMSWLGIDKDTFSRVVEGRSYTWDYDVPSLGYKLHGNAIMAALAIVQLRYLEEDNERRRLIASWYDQGLCGDPEIERVSMTDGCVSSRHLYQILVRDRDDVIEHLQRSHIFPGVHYRNNQDFVCYNDTRHDCPAATRFAREVISLPMSLGLTRQQIGRICQSVKTAVRPSIPA